MLSTLSRSAEDNPNHIATYTDIVWMLTFRNKMFSRDIKTIKKFYIYRPHKCYRNIGSAVAYDIGDETLVYEYDANGICDEYKIIWNQDKECFEDDNTCVD